MNWKQVSAFLELFCIVSIKLYVYAKRILHRADHQYVYIKIYTDFHKIQKIE